MFAYKVVEASRARLAFAPSEEETRLARDYARKARAGFGRAKETAVRSSFIHDILVGVLGYKALDPERPYSLAEEEPVARGAVDVALGRFGATAREIHAPFELKGPTTHDLDAPMPGRGRSPVQQAWDYAADVKGARWVLVSNCLEIRLYGFGRGRETYETFDLGRLDEPEEHARLYLMLAADRLLEGRLDELLRETDSAYRDITDKLYKDYSGLRDRLIDYLVNAADGPHLTSLDAIEPAQKILDRILFIAFAQRTDLLPDRLLEDASKASNKFAPQPLWANFTALFRAVDRGKRNRTSGPTTAACSRTIPLWIARAAGCSGRRSRRSRQMGFSQRSAGDAARPYLRTIRHRHRAIEGARARRTGAGHAQAQARGRRLYARHGDALSGREDDRRHARRGLRAFARRRMV